MQRIFANALKRLREKTGLSQAVVAKRAGIAQSEVSRLEGGTHWPSYQTILKLMVAMDDDGEFFGHFIANDILSWDQKIWNSFKEDIKNYKEEKKKNERNK